MTERSDPFFGLARSEQRSLLKRVCILTLIHDLLPFDDEAPGLSAPELRAKLARMGIARSVLEVRRDLKYLSRVAWVEVDAESRSCRYRRLYSQSLSGGLTGRRGAGIPDWQSDIDMGDDWGRP